MTTRQAWVGSLPELKGFYICHAHEEGEPCWTAGDAGCRYRYRLTTRLRRHLRIIVE